ncbi:MAG: hypothetical protein WBN27_01575, partial [Eudoraea sp.]
MKSYKLFLIILGLFLVNCKTNQEPAPKFQHDIKMGPTPWTSESFELEEEDFTFAIISDLNGSERKGVYSTA